MKSSNVFQTHGELRKQIIESILGIRDGSIDPTQAAKMLAAAKKANAAARRRLRNLCSLTASGSLGTFKEGPGK